MGFKIDRMTAQDRILSKFDKIIKSEKRKEQESLKEQLEKLEAEKIAPKAKKEEKAMYVPIFDLQYKIENKNKK
jgi:hypothetical protein